MTTELERLVPLDRVSARGTDIVVEALEEERTALARRLAIPAVLQLRCRFRLRRAAAGVVDADGMLDARVVRTSVVTLDDLSPRTWWKRCPAPLRANRTGGRGRGPRRPGRDPLRGHGTRPRRKPPPNSSPSRSTLTPREPGAALPEGSSDPAPAPLRRARPVAEELTPSCGLARPLLDAATRTRHNI